MEQKRSFIVNEHHTKTTITQHFIKTEEEFFGEKRRSIWCVPDFANRNPKFHIWVEKKIGGDFLHKVLDFDQTDVFTLKAGDWTLRLNQWTGHASYTVELREGKTLRVLVEWWNQEEEVDIRVKGQPFHFMRFAEQVLKPEE